MLWKIAHIYYDLITCQFSALEFVLGIDLNITEGSSRWYSIFTYFKCPKIIQLIPSALSANFCVIFYFSLFAVRHLTSPEALTQMRHGSDRLWSELKIKGELWTWISQTFVTHVRWDKVCFYNFQLYKLTFHLHVLGKSPFQIWLGCNAISLDSVYKWHRRASFTVLS